MIQRLFQKSNSAKQLKECQYRSHPRSRIYHDLKWRNGTLFPSPQTGVNKSGIHVLSPAINQGNPGAGNKQSCLFRVTRWLNSSRLMTSETSGVNQPRSLAWPYNPLRSISCLSRSHELLNQPRQIVRPVCLVLTWSAFYNVTQLFSSPIVLVIDSKRNEGNSRR